MTEDTTPTQAPEAPQFPMLQYGLASNGMNIQAILAPGLILTMVVDEPSMNAISGKWLELQREKHQQAAAATGEDDALAPVSISKKRGKK
jgi:hypothetical protein